MRKIVVAWASCLACCLSMSLAYGEDTKPVVDEKVEQAKTATDGDLKPKDGQKADSKSGDSKEGSKDAASPDSSKNSTPENSTPENKGKLTDSPAEMRQIGALPWHTDYSAAYREAVKDHKQLLLFFRDEKDLLNAAQFEQNVLAQAELREPLAKFARVILPTTAAIPQARDAKSDQPPALLLTCPCFAHMHGQPGLAIVDLVSEKDHLFGKCVSAHPFRSNTLGSTGTVKVLLELHRGTITQRTLTFVLRTHPEQPASVWGTTDPYLLDQARLGAQLMANYGSVGHHDWGNRSAQIGAYYGSGPNEVASMGGGFTLFDVAHSCINLWRTSGVHWGMMITPGRYFGYDMVQSPNGTWYANGIMVR